MSRARFGINASNVTMVDYYPQLAQHSMLARDILQGTVYFMPRQSTRVTLSPSFKNLPEFSFSELFDPDQGQGVPVNQDLRMTVDRYTRFGSTLEVSQKLSTRTQAMLGLNYGRGKIASREWTIKQLTGRISHNISKGVALYVGFMDGGQRDKGSTSKASQRQPRIDGGIDYGRALSFSRRTTVSFSTGVAGAHDRVLDQTSYQLIGAARLNREFGRTWVAGLSYSRNVRQIESLGEPLLSNSVTLGVQGAFSQRIQFQSRVGKTTGRFGSTGSGLDSQFGSVQVSVALTRLLAWGTDYASFRSSARSGAGPLESFGQRDSRSVRTYLQVRVPLFTRTKRP